MSALQESQADVFLWSNYYYVALTSLWVYDYTLCISDSVAFIVESRSGLGTVFYLACSHLPSVFLLLNMLVTFLPSGSSTVLCRFLYITNIWMLSMFSAECIFLLRMLAVWQRERRFAVIKTINVIAYLVAIIVCFQKFNSSAGECSIPGGIRYVDTKAKSFVIVVYCLLVVAESEILACVLYRAIESHGGWRIETRLMRGLVHHNLLYFGCSFAFSLGVILATIFLPFPVVHMITETQVVALSLLVTRMHRDFWRSDRAACSIDVVDVSLTTFMTAAPDVV